jgi:hypothetical protein
MDIHYVHVQKLLRRPPVEIPALSIDVKKAARNRVEQKHHGKAVPEKAAKTFFALSKRFFRLFPPCNIAGKTESSVFPLIVDRLSACFYPHFAPVNPQKTKLYPFTLRAALIAQTPHPLPSDVMIERMNALQKGHPEEFIT